MMLCLRKDQNPQARVTRDFGLANSLQMIRFFFSFVGSIPFADVTYVFGSEKDKSGW